MIKNKEIYLLYIKKAFGLLTIMLLCFFLYNNQDKLLHLKVISFQNFVFLMFLNLLNLFILTFIQQTTVKPFIDKVSFFYIFKLISIGQLSNLIFPSKIGMWTPGLYLKTKYNFDYKIFSFGVMLQAIIAILVLIFISINIYFIKENSFILTGTFSSLFIAFIFFLYTKFGLPKVLKKNKLIPQVFNKLFNRKVFIKITIAHVFILFIYVLRIYFVFEYTGINLSFYSCFFACIFTLVLGAVPFLPGVIGIREATISSYLLIYGVDLVTVSSVLLLERCAQLIITTPFSVMGYLNNK